MTPSRVVGIGAGAGAGGASGVGARGAADGAACSASHRRGAGFGDPDEGGQLLDEQLELLEAQRAVVDVLAAGLSVAAAEESAMISPVVEPVTVDNRQDLAFDGPQSRRRPHVLRRRKRRRARLVAGHGAA